MNFAPINGAAAALTWQEMIDAEVARRRDAHIAQEADRIWSAMLAASVAPAAEEVEALPVAAPVKAGSGGKKFCQLSTVTSWLALPGKRTCPLPTAGSTRMRVYEAVRGLLLAGPASRATVLHLASEELGMDKNNTTSVISYLVASGLVLVVRESQAVKS